MTTMLEELSLSNTNAPLDITPIIRNFSFFDALGNVSQRASRKYLIVIEPIVPEEDFAFTNDIKFNMSNVITGNNILPTSLKNTGFYSINDGYWKLKQ